MDQETRKLVRDYGGTILAAIIVALFVRFFVIEAYRIPTAAMKPALEPGDTVFVAKWPFGLKFPWSSDSITQGRAPRRGEVVVVSLPTDRKREYIKRVVGLPGDTVQVRSGQVILNGVPLRVTGANASASCAPEKLPDGLSYEACIERPNLIEDFGPEKVPEGSVFVIGDFRSRIPSDARASEAGVSRGPRTWGIFPISSVRGKALWIWLSLEPRGSGWFPQFRFHRMLRSVK